MAADPSLNSRPSTRGVCLVLRHPLRELRITAQFEAKSGEFDAEHVLNLAQIGETWLN